MGILERIRASKKVEEVKKEKVEEDIKEENYQILKRKLRRRYELEDYFKTDRWEELRSQRFSMDNHECVLCANQAEQVHHRRYPEVLGTETVDDLVSLCGRCHLNHHYPPGLKESIEMVDEAVIEKNKPVKCPTCERRCARSLKRINYKCVMFLRDLIIEWEKNGHDWVENSKHVNKDNPKAKASADAVFLRHWGLIERKPPEESEKGKISQPKGIYRPTQMGIDFLEGKILVKKAFWEWRGVMYWSDDSISVQDALGTPFDYEEVVTGVLREERSNLNGI